MRDILLCAGIVASAYFNFSGVLDALISTSDEKIKRGIIKVKVGSGLLIAAVIVGVLTM